MAIPKGSGVVDEGGRAVDERLYRCNPRYVLRRPDDLDPAQRERLLGADPDVAAARLLVPAGAPDDGTIKAVSALTARLLEELAVPTRLPSSLWPAIGGRELGDMVGAEMLEVEIAGRFLTGIEALARLLPAPDEPPSGPLAALSLEAIAYAESLHFDELAVVADRLYAFHRLALRPSWRSTAFGDAFRARMSAAMPRGLEADPRWVEIRRIPWRAYWRRNASAHAEAPIPKLYVSPTTGCLNDVVAASIPLISNAPGVLGWKIANTAEAMVRPDKFLVYLDSLQSLERLAKMLSSVLAGAAVHGVPFTCAIGLDGLLSFGVDPVSSPHRPDSWRTWMAARLAGGLVRIDIQDSQSD